MVAVFSHSRVDVGVVVLLLVLVLVFVAGGVFDFVNVTAKALFA